ncbi:MAG: DUF2000 domain-containing protein [Candidatus Colwellbacteria bacterium]|nr:DUF2000 domain-containing protein [Candidatus Colwellbacteria bacterium]
MLQDFNKKMVIVVRNDLPSWQVLNTVAHVSAYLGNKMRDTFGTGDYFVTKNNIKHPRNSQYAIVTLSCKPNELKTLIKTVRDSGLDYIGFIREMIETTDDSEIEKILASKNDEDIEYLGIGIFGDKEKVSELTKKFSLWK